MKSGRRKSLEDVHSSVRVDHSTMLKRMLAFAGPAYMVSVGYMDPGNWATDIEGGSRFGYELLWVLLLSNALAVLLQTLSARMGIVTGRDLAQACREMYSKPVSIMLWLLCEVAIAACDLAEVIGTIIGLNLLFGLPLGLGLIVTLCDTLMLLAIQRLGIRKMEAFILTLIFTIGLCFVLEVLWAQPFWSEAVRGLVPVLSSSPPFVFRNHDALYVAIGILGATVMPHNLYLHSALVQSRSVKRDRSSMAQACRYNFVDSLVALNAAFFVNAAILVLAATAFFRQGVIVSEIQEAYRLLPQFLGTRAASVLFAVALLCAGQSSTLTGTLAGQIVMEGFIHLRLRPWVRRLLTRSIAILPAAFVIFLVGSDRLTDLLVLSQVVLSLQLSFAVVPLIQCTSDRSRMGEFSNRLWLKILAWTGASIILMLNAYLVFSQMQNLIAGASFWMSIAVLPVPFGCTLLLLWLFIEPRIRRHRIMPEDATVAHDLASTVADSMQKPQYRRIAVAVENKPHDAIPLEHAAALAKSHHAELLILHVVEGVGGQIFGSDASDEESRLDHAYVENLAGKLRAEGIHARGIVRFGNPAEELLRTIRDEKIDFIVLRSHGHRFFGDRFFGQTINALRHAAKIPVLAVSSPITSPRTASRHR